MTAAATPITVLVGALGGEGGGVLAEWLYAAAARAGHAAQSTSVPGVAQRTGATTYYIEVCPLPQSALGGRRPVFSLNPVPGAIDLLVSSELLETLRQAAVGGQEIGHQDFLAVDLGHDHVRLRRGFLRGQRRCRDGGEQRSDGDAAQGGESDHRGIPNPAGAAARRDKAKPDRGAAPSPKGPTRPVVHRCCISLMAKQGGATPRHDHKRVARHGASSWLG